MAGNGLWNELEPVAGTHAHALYGLIRNNNSGIQSALEAEHIFNGTTAGLQTGAHKQGSARCFYQASAPATTVDGSAFASTDLGMIWIDSDDKQVYILTAIGPPLVWTVISTELFATFLAAARVFGSTLGVTGDFAVNTDKFKVIATSGNTTVAGTLGVTGLATVGGTLGVTGIATLGDTSALATSAAPAADAQIANKKYVDDQIVAKVPLKVRVQAWVNFNGATAAINDSSGVTSVVRNSAGNYTITWSTAFADANYFFNAFSNRGVEPYIVNGAATNPLTVTTANVIVADRSNNAADPTVVCAMAIGLQ
jgi:hypothetical protein